MFSKRQGFIMYEAVIGMAVLCLTIQLCMGMLQNCQQQMTLEQTRLAEIEARFEKPSVKPKQAYKKRKSKQPKVYRTKRAGTDLATSMSMD